MCQYKDIFGEPGTGAHRHRIFGLAAVDLIATVLLAIIIAFASGRTKNIIGIFMVLVVASIFFHWLFCVPTTGMIALGIA